MRRTSLVLAGLLVLALVLTGCGGDDEPSAGGEGASSTTPPIDPTDSPSGADGGDGSVLELSVDTTADTGRCAVPTPEIVEGNDTAFDGVVSSIEGEWVTLRPTAFYAGESADTVIVQAPDADLQALLGAVGFEKGKRYLVAASEGQVALCTVSAAWSKQLESVYVEAFGTPS